MNARLAALLAFCLLSCQRASNPSLAGARSVAGLAGANPIAAENALPGTADWVLGAVAVDAQLEGYAGATSVNHGETLDVHVRADDVHTVSYQLFRMGYYGGLGGRLVSTAGPFDVGPQDTPAPAATGLMECAWPTTFTVQTDPAWTSGVYLLKLIRDDGLQRYVIFVVRADERKGGAIVQASFATWQAYNDWQGESLYVDTLVGLSHAFEVSYDRPFTHNAGAGEFFDFEQPLVLWLEARGYDVGYVTNVDVDQRPQLLAGQKLLVSAGHDEYWSRSEKTAVQKAIAAGTSVAFLSANTAYWQIRLEPSHTTGAPARTEVCYKLDAPARDPLAATNLTTNLWRDPTVGEPENALLGVMYEAWQPMDAPWIARNTAHWLFAGTGMKDGDSIPRLVGYEADRLFANGLAPAGLQTLASGPVIDHAGGASWHDATLYTAPSGAFVFAGGTIHWSWGLSKAGTADVRVQKMTDNLLQRAGLQPATIAPTFGAGELSADMSAAARSVTTFAGSSYQEGLVDGPLQAARFRRPMAAAVDSAGTIYVADAGNHAVRRISGATVTTLAGNGTAGLADGTGAQVRLWRPNGIAAGADGNVYVADTGNNRIVQITPGGAASTFAGSPNGDVGFADGQGAAALFNLPAGIAAAPDGSLYVADTGNNRICQLDLAGNVTTVVGGSGPGVASRRGGARPRSFVTPIDGAGTGAMLNWPASIAVGDGALWVVEAENRDVRRVALDGAYTTTTAAGSAPGGFADGPAASAQLMPNAGVAWLDGALYLADSGNDRIRMLSADQVRTLAGTGQDGAVDGPGATATFSLPMGLVALPDGSLLVVDEGDSTLRKIVR